MYYTQPIHNYSDQLRTIFLDNNFVFLLLHRSCKIIDVLTSRLSLHYWNKPALPHLSWLYKGAAAYSTVTDKLLDRKPIEKMGEKTQTLHIAAMIAQTLHKH